MGNQFKNPDGFLVLGVFWPRGPATGGVLSSIDDTLGQVAGVDVEVHAGRNYLGFGLAEGLIARGARISDPLQGLPQGKRLRFYKEEGCL